MDSAITSSRDILLYAVPLVIVLLASMFKLDELLGAHKSKGARRRPMQRYSTLRTPIMSDPDGRPWTA